jgi:hypothetical protein
MSADPRPQHTNPLPNYWWCASVDSIWDEREHKECPWCQGPPVPRRILRVKLLQRKGASTARLVRAALRGAETPSKAAKLLNLCEVPPPAGRYWTARKVQEATK